MSYRFDFSSLLAYWPDILAGAWLTLQLSVASTLFGFAIGTLCAIGRVSRNPWLRRPIGAYVEIVRNTPLLVQIFLVFFGIASLGFRIPAVVAAVTALVINIAAYTCEIVRAGIESVHKGQVEAAECLGMSRAQVYWHVILRPAIERVYPALTGQYVLLMLATSITSQISVEDLTGIANNVQSSTFRSFETYIVVALLYLALSFVVRAGFWLLGQFVFVRRRKLRTPL
jgi:polar amino acid transport system permease protein